MRRLLFNLLFAFSFFYANSQKTIQSKIDTVTVFLKGAQVERSAKQNLSVGKYDIVFDGISPKIDKQSIQLKAEGKLSILSVTHQINFLKEQHTQEEIKQIDLQKEALLDKVEMEKNMQSVYKQEEQMIIKNQSIKGDNATLKANELKEAADFQRQRLTEIYQKLQESDRNLKKMDSDLQKFNKQLIELNQKKDLSTSEIIVAVDVKEAANASFHLSYLVTQSEWYPTYDIRVQDIAKSLTLQMKANLKQQSGEDWKDVKLFLSTGDPNENGTKPALLPWYLKYYYPIASSSILIRGSSTIYGSQAPNIISGIVRDEKGVPVPGATVAVKGTNIATTTNASGNFLLQPPAGNNTIVVSYVGYGTQEIGNASGYANITLKEQAQALQEVVVGYSSEGSDDFYYNGRSYKKKDAETAINTTTLYKPTTTVFEIENPYSVPNDGKIYTADINSYELNALYEYYAVPKLDADAYLTAKVVDWQELNLLPGQANLFFEGTYLGNSSLDVMNAGDTLKLSLGIDKGVVIKRTLLKEYSQKKFFGANKTDTRQYEIVVRNNKQQSVNIVVEDQFPISTNKDIEVEKLSHEGGRIDDDTKKITWNLTVDPKKETKLQLGYSVKYPKDKTLQVE